MSALSIGEEPFAYAAGNDGSIFIISLEDDEYPSNASHVSIDKDDKILKMSTEHLKPVSEMKLFTDIMKEEFERSNAEKKAEFKRAMMQKLGVIQ